MTPAVFLKKQKELLGEVQRQSGAAPTWDDPQLNSFRDDEISLLYSKGLYRMNSTRSLAGWTESVIPTYSTGVIQRYFAMPLTMRRAYKVEFMDPTTDESVWKTFHFDTDEEPGFIRIDGASGYEGYKVRLYGEFEYTTIDLCTAEVADVCKFGSVIRALVGQYVQRQRANRARTSTRTTDVSPGAIAAGIAVIGRQYEKAVADALSIQSVRAYG